MIREAQCMLQKQKGFCMVRSKYDGRRKVDNDVVSFGVQVVIVKLEAVKGAAGLR